MAVIKKLNFKVKKYVTLQLFKTFSKVNFYTFRFEDSSQSETDKFFSKFENNVLVETDLLNLVSWLSLIGQKYGAKSGFFRHESAAMALPPPMAKMVKEVIVNDLRLYCVWISDEIVILANGGMKQSQKVQDSPEIMRHFRFANMMSVQITEMIYTNDFQYVGKQILNLNNIELIY